MKRILALLSVIVHLAPAHGEDFLFKAEHQEEKPRLLAFLSSPDYIVTHIQGELRGDTYAIAIQQKLCSTPELTESCEPYGYSESIAGIFTRTQASLEEQNQFGLPPQTIRLNLSAGKTIFVQANGDAIYVDALLESLPLPLSKM